MTAVQPVHLSRIGTIEAIEQAKGELVEALPADGVAVLNADDERVRRMADADRARGSSPTASRADADVGAEDVESPAPTGCASSLVAGRRRGGRSTIPTLGRLGGPQRARRGGRRARRRASRSSAIVAGARRAAGRRRIAASSSVPAA